MIIAPESLRFYLKSNLIIWRMVETSKRMPFWRFGARFHQAMVPCSNRRQE